MKDVFFSNAHEGCHDFLPGEAEHLFDEEKKAIDNAGSMMHHGHEFLKTIGDNALLKDCKASVVNVVFFGTPEPSARLLETLIDDGFFQKNSDTYRIRGAVTSPPRPQGRYNNILRTTPVGCVAERHGLPCITPSSLHSNEAITALRHWTESSSAAINVLLLFSYGKLIPPTVLQMFDFALNLHGSLLPRYRGAAPLQRALMNQDAFSGVTLMEMNANIDEGRIYGQHAFALTTTDTYIEALHKATQSAITLIKTLMPSIVRGDLTPVDQLDDKTPITFLPNSDGITDGPKPLAISYAPKIHSEDGQIDWQCDAYRIDALRRGLIIWPGIYTFFEGKRVKIILGHPHKMRQPSSCIVGSWKVVEPQDIYGDLIDEGLCVICGDTTCYEVLSLHIEGAKKPFTAQEFLCGYFFRS